MFASLRRGGRRWERVCERPAVPMVESAVGQLATDRAHARRVHRRAATKLAGLATFVLEQVATVSAGALDLAALTDADALAAPRMSSSSAGSSPAEGAGRALQMCTNSVESAHARHHGGARLVVVGRVVAFVALFGAGVGCRPTLLRVEHHAHGAPLDLGRHVDDGDIT